MCDLFSIKYINILNDQGVIVGQYSLLDNAIFSINILPEYRKLGHAKRIIRSLLSDGSIAGPSEVCFSHILRKLWTDLGYASKLQPLQDVINTKEFQDAMLSSKSRLNVIR